MVSSTAVNNRYADQILEENVLRCSSMQDIDLAVFY